MTSTASRQVNYLSVYEFVSPDLGDPSLIPGTPRWCDLDATDPVKRQALLWPAVWWSLNEDVRQAQMAEASHDVAEAVDTQSIARGVLRQEWRRESGVYIPREVA